MQPFGPVNDALRTGWAEAEPVASSSVRPASNVDRSTIFFLNPGRLKAPVLRAYS